jgi:hypothetical protein
MCSGVTLWDEPGGWIATRSPSATHSPRAVVGALLSDPRVDRATVVAVAGGSWGADLAVACVTLVAGERVELGAGDSEART